MGKETRELAESRGFTVDDKHEIHHGYNQPTYRGLFTRAFELGGTDVVMYTNGDILFTPGLQDTIKSVMLDLKQNNKPLEFMIVGHRINVDVDPTKVKLTSQNWKIQLKRWALQGSVFQTNAEDYF